MTASRVPGADVEVTLPVLPLHDFVLLPAGFTRVVIRGSSPLVDHLLSRKGEEALVAAIPCLSESPPSGDEDAGGFNLDALHDVGTVARVVQLVRRPETDAWVLTLEGQSRARVLDVSASPDAAPASLFSARLAVLDPSPSPPREGRAEEEAAARLVNGTMRLLLAMQGPSEGRDAARRVASVLRAQTPSRAADIVGSLVARTRRERLQVLSAAEVFARQQLVGALLERLLDAAGEVKEGALTASGGGDGGRAGGLQRPSGAKPGFRPGTGLGGGPRLRVPPSEAEEEGREEVQAAWTKLLAADPPSEVLAAAGKEYRRLLRSSDQSPNYGVGVTYLETLADIPWRRCSADLHAEGKEGREEGKDGKEGRYGREGKDGKERRDGREGKDGKEGRDGKDGPIPRSLGPPIPPPSLASVRAQLDADHAGLDRVKARIVEYVAVASLRGWDARAPILCLAGPPGVGKTSLARSVSLALRRPLARLALGGVRDEAEIRGHRRTYVGALPGRVVQSLRRAQVRDPVLLLDEVDKLGRDARGDPAAALLEVLDPEQNSAFMDAYVALPLDLSRVLFIATANRLDDIPAPLLDRMEVVHLPGSTLAEKKVIARRHLLPRVLREHGLPENALVMDDEALDFLVRGYTREAGVRQLERALSALARRVAVDLVRAREAGEAGGVEDRPPALEEERVAARGMLGGAPRAASKPQHKPAWLAWLPGQRSAKAACDEGRDWGAGSGPGAPGSGPGALGALPSPGSLPIPGSAGEAAWAGEKGGRGRRKGAPSSEKGVLFSETARVLGSSFAVAPAPRPRAAPLALAPVAVTPRMIQEVLRAPRFLEPDAAEGVRAPGAAAGLVWTAVGGSVQYVECIRVSPGAAGRTGVLTLTGQLGEVLEESAHIAMSWIRAHMPLLGVEGAGKDGYGACDEPPGSSTLFSTSPSGSSPASPPGSSPTTSPSGSSPTTSPSGASPTSPSRLAPLPAANWDIHVHFPAGGVPKDGPSAGVTLAVALVSLLAGRAARADTAMTGELTLRGLVLPVGGLDQKVAAAHASGFRRVVVPRRNLADVLAEVPAQIRAGLEVLPCDNLHQVLELAFDPPMRASEHALAKA